MIASPFVRQCTEIEAFVSSHGVDDYKRTFRPHATIEELLQDERVARGNDDYEKDFGSGVTQEHRCAYIEQWGISQYKDWFERYSDYRTIVQNPKFAAAEQVFLENRKYKQFNVPQYKEWLERDSYCPTMQTSKFVNPPEIQPDVEQYMEDPFHRNMRDIRGVAVPEPSLIVGEEDFYDGEYELYIQENGILNYMLKVNSPHTLEKLLHYPDVAFWQRCYIRKLEYDDKIESIV